LVCGIVQDIELETEFPDRLSKIERALSYVSSDVKAYLKSDKVLAKLEGMDSKLDSIRIRIDEI
jgi:hypothetical protein